MTNVEIEIDEEHLELLDDLRAGRGISRDEMLQILIYNAFDHEPLSEEELQAIEQGLKDYAEGKCKTIEEIEEEINKKENEG